MLLILMAATGICSAANVNVDIVNQFGEDISDVAVAGSYAYVGQGENFVILDITDITNIFEIARITAPSGIEGIEVSGTNAYLADAESGIVILDVSNPSSPVIVGNYATEYSILDVAVSGNYVYAADSNDLIIIDATTPSSPTLVGSYETIGSANGVAISGNYAYVADDSKAIFDGSNGLSIVDISNPTSPTLAGTYADVYAYDVAVSGNYAYVADSSGLIILDVSNPSSPTLAGRYSGSGDSNAVAISGNYAYLVDYGGLVILDISNPASLLNMGSYGEEYASDVDVSDGYVFVADYSNGLVVVKLGNSSGTTVSDDNSTTDDDGTDVRPSISEIGDKSVNVNELLEFTVSATSSDGSEITYSARGLPNGAILDETTGDFSWVPTYSDAGEHFVTFDAQSNGLAASETITITVYGSAASSEGSAISELSGSDISSSSITLTWSNSADIATVDLYRDSVLIGNVTAPTSTYVDTGLASDTSYSYSLLPHYINGTQGIVASITLSTSSSSSSSSGSDSSSGGSSSGGGSGGSSSASTSSKSSSSGGGGGGSGSAENFENIVLKDVSNEYLRINSNVTYEFSREGNPIESISFYSLKNSGEITTSIEVLKNQSQFVNSSPEGLIYKYINIWVGKSGFATESNLKDAQVKFKVNSSWIEEMGLSPESIRLQRYDGTSWEVLPTTLQNETAGYLVFESQTPGFSPFAIIGDKNTGASLNTTDTNLKTPESETPSGAVSTESQSSAQTQPEKSNMLVPVMAILGIGLLVVGYLYMRRS